MKIGVIGAGTMGQGIAKAFAQVGGNTVALCDIKQEWADNGKAKIAKGYDRLVAKGKMTKAKADEICAAITWTRSASPSASSLPTLRLCPSPRSARA